MGTRAVVHVGNIWIATHWDGYPTCLGESLKKAIKDEKTQYKNKYGKDWKMYRDIVQKAVWKGAAEHTIDFSTTSGKDDFDKLYGDWAEYEYEVDAKTGRIKVREREGEWQKAKIGKWKPLDNAIVAQKAAEKKLKRVL